MTLSVVTVAWNSSEYIADQIRSVILACDGLEYEHIVVDNASSDKTVDTIKETFPSIKLIQNAENKGFAAANNQGYKEAQGEFLLFLNPDMKMVGEGSLRKWVEWMKASPAIGISGCKLVREPAVISNEAKRNEKSSSPNSETRFLANARNDKPEFNPLAGPRRFPTFFDQLMILLKVPHLFPRVLDNYLYKGFDANKEQELDSVRGSCMLVRRELLDKLGFAFDPRYRIWFEDVDLCKEAHKNGFKVVFTPMVSAVDLVGTSFSKRNIVWKQFQLVRSMAKYFWKWGFRKLPPPTRGRTEEGVSSRAS